MKNDTPEQAYWAGYRAERNSLCPYSYFTLEELSVHWWRGRRDAFLAEMQSEEEKKR